MLVGIKVYIIYTYVYKNTWYLWLFNWKLCSYNHYIYIYIHTVNMYIHIDIYESTQSLCRLKEVLQLCFYMILLFEKRQTRGDHCVLRVFFILSEMCSSKYLAHAVPFGSPDFPVCVRVSWITGTHQNQSAERTRYIVLRCQKKKRSHVVQCGVCESVSVCICVRVSVYTSSYRLPTSVFERQRGEKVWDRRGKKNSQFKGGKTVDCLELSQLFSGRSAVLLMFHSSSSDHKCMRANGSCCLCPA